MGLNENILADADDGRGKWGKDVIVAFIKECRRIPGCKDDETRQLFLAMEASREPRRSQIWEEIWVRNLPLVMSVTKRYIGYGAIVGFSYSDLINEGAIGLHRAMELYDTSRVEQFSTYATSWIRQAIMRALADANQSQGGRIPVHAQDFGNWVKKAQRSSEQEQGREPTPYEVFQKLQEMAKKTDRPPPSLKAVGDALKILQRRVVSADTATHEENDGAAPMKILPDPRPRPDTVLDAKEQLAEIVGVVARIEAWVATLPPRTGGILTLRLGLFGRSEHTLEECGERYEVTRERIRQIEEKALPAMKEALGFEAEEVRELIKMQERLKQLLTT